MGLRDTSRASIGSRIANSETTLSLGLTLRIAGMSRLSELVNLSMTSRSCPLVTRPRSERRVSIFQVARKLVFVLPALSISDLT